MSLTSKLPLDHQHIPCCDWGECSEVGEPASAKPSKFEIDGKEHFDVSSMGGDGGGT